MSKLLEELIEDQINVEFTGRIQLLDNVNFSIKGAIVFKDGRIIDAKFENKIGERAFISAMIHESDCCMVLEPEFIDQKVSIRVSYRELIESFEDALLEHKYYEYFTVPKGVELVVNPDFIKKGAGLSNDEYSILLALVKDGYEKLSLHLNLLDFEITKSLISLRKKNALKTISYNRRELRV